MPTKERDVCKMIAEVEATSWRLLKCIRLRELAETHRLERMRRLRMLEEQGAWKREAGFDRIEIIAQMDTQRLSVDFDSGPLDTKLYNPRWPHTPEEHTLEMRSDVERLRIKIVFSQPAPPPQCGSSPRRSPAVGTGLDEPGALRTEMQSMEREGIFPQASLNDCTSLDQEDTTIFLQADIGVDNAETTTTKAQVAALEEFTRPPKKRQQRTVTAWGAVQTEQFDPGGLRNTQLFFRCTSVCLVCFFSLVSLYFSVFLLCKISPSRYEKRGDVSIKDESDWDA